MSTLSDEELARLDADWSEWADHPKYLERHASHIIRELVAALRQERQTNACVEAKADRLREALDELLGAQFDADRALDLARGRARTVVSELAAYSVTKENQEIAGREVAGETPAVLEASRPATVGPCQTCGHAKRDHIYEEGACRPGFVCPAACTAYAPPDPTSPATDTDARIEAAAQAAFLLGGHLHPWEQSSPATQDAYRRAIRDALARPLPDNTLLCPRCGNPDPEGYTREELDG